jgi:hypothetical protein
LILLAVLAAGCQLQEVEIAEIDDVVVVEVVLLDGATQKAWLHRTRTAGKSPLVPNAVVTVTADDGRVFTFQPDSALACIFGRRSQPAPNLGSCYTANFSTVPGRTYHLNVRTDDGRELTGTTTVPQPFTLIRPRAPLGFCRLPPQGKLEIMWSASPGAWVYAAETELNGIRAVLRNRNIEIEEDPVRLFGLSLSATDTTIVFPNEFGLFDRLDGDLTEALAVLQEGLPTGIRAEIVISAADRNYVNWERGGNFNPSGFVRVPSVFGAGTGVFGSLVGHHFWINETSPADAPPC